MTKLQHTKTLSSGTNYSVSLLLELQDVQDHTDTELRSGDRCFFVHSAILRKCSKLIAEMLTTSDTKVIILHMDFSSILSDFVSIIYTGQAPSLKNQSIALLKSLCADLGITCSDVTVNTDSAEDTHAITQVVKSEFLKVKTTINGNPSFPLRMPVSRVDQSDKSYNSEYVFLGFKGRVQEEYNRSPIGPFEGPYDQDPRVLLVAQLPKTNLNFKKYTNFVHPEEIPCKTFRINEDYQNIADLHKIDSLEVVNDSTGVFVEPDKDDQVFYTCKKKSCNIPCPCNVCASGQGQCPEHQIKHIELFDEEAHSFSVRSTEQACTNENFFRCSYVLKYPGIPSACSLCAKDLLNHKSYHLKFHWNCKLCKLYQYKLYPKTIKALKERETKEEIWYKSVCPHCDKKFSEPYQRNRHVEREHKNKKIKCEKCPQLFQSQQSLQYHDLVKHTSDTPPSFTCDKCPKTFVAQVTLANHIKFKHSDERKFKCSECDSTFKQRKNLNAHLLSVHGTNPRREDYWQDIARKTIKCENCGAKFMRKADLKAHVKIKHAVEDVAMFSCNHCEQKYRYKKNLQQHKLEKHEKEEIKYECPNCGKLFRQKRNMERHQVTHREK